MQFIPSVTSDNYEMGWLIGDHFGKRNHKHVAFIRIQGHQSGELTAQGYKDALEQYGVAFSDKDTFYSSVEFQTTYDVVKSNLDQLRKYDAIFAQNDTMALGVISALHDQGISVPADIAVAGNNDYPSAQWFSPRLTTVRTFVDKQSQIACDRMVAFIRKGVDPCPEMHYVVRPQLVIRESCP